MSGAIKLKLMSLAKSTSTPRSRSRSRAPTHFLTQQHIALAHLLILLDRLFRTYFVRLQPAYAHRKLRTVQLFVFMEYDAYMEPKCTQNLFHHRSSMRTVQLPEEVDIGDTPLSRSYVSLIISAMCLTELTLSSHCRVKELELSCLIICTCSLELPASCDLLRHCRNCLFKEHYLVTF